MSPAPADDSQDVIDRTAGRLYDRVSRLLDERTTNQASATQVIVDGLREEIASHAEAMHELSAQIVGLRGELRPLLERLEEIASRHGADLADHELRLRALEREPPAGFYTPAAD